VAFHRRFHVLFPRAGLELQRSVQSVQLEEVAVGWSRRRTGATVARAAEVVPPLSCPTQVERFDLGHVLGELGDGRRSFTLTPGEAALAPMNASLCL